MIYKKRKRGNCPEISGIFFSSKKREKTWQDFAHQKGKNKFFLPNSVEPVVRYITSSLCLSQNGIETYICVEGTVRYSVAVVNPMGTILKAAS